MKPRFDYGDHVRVIRNVRNDGTYPGLDMGKHLVRRGSVGYVQNVGTYLQEYIIYSVHFLDENMLVGCREEELILADEPWLPSKFEFRDKVVTRIPLSVTGQVVVARDTAGEVLKVIRDASGGVAYHVRFPGRTFQVPETALEPAKWNAESGPEHAGARS